MDVSPTILAAGIDWITCSASNPAHVDLLQLAGEKICIAAAQAGNDLRPWLWKGYEGLTCGGASVGRRADGSLVRLSSDYAALNWNVVHKFSDNVSRCDLAVTVRLGPEANPAGEAYSRPAENLPSRRGRHVQRATHIQTWTEGETTYLGSRQSARFGRLYNKGLESKREEYRDCWRWEVEYKGATAKDVAGKVAQCGSEGEAVLAYVWDTFATWGVPPAWGLGATVPPALAVRTPTDEERRLAWLYAQVRPAVARLVAAGRREAVLSALGLD